MSYKDTINAIFRGLSGDRDADIEYLKGQMEKYKDDEDSVEIVRALSRKIFELLPEESKEEIGRVIGNEVDKAKATVEKARLLLNNNEAVSAEKTLRALIDSIPLEFNDDKECGYFCFDDALEIAIFYESENFRKTIRRPTYNFSEIYYLYGYSLIENGKIDEAEAALKTALRWNPVSTTVMSELSEVYKRRQDYERFLFWSKQILRYASSKQMLARGYRNIAYYYCDIEEYEKSAAIYYYSYAFEENPQAQAELFYIAEKLGDLPKPLKPKAIFRLLEQEDIQQDASDFVIGCAFQLYKAAMDGGAPRDAMRYLSVVYDLTHDEKIMDLINVIELSLDEK